MNIPTFSDDKKRMTFILERLTPSIKKNVEDEMENPLSNELESSIKTDHRNHITGLNQFLKQWDIQTDKPIQNNKGNRKSSIGNINQTGSPACITARIYTPRESEFEDSIEPGVKSLVLKLINKLDCITFSSCEGHFGIIEGKNYFRSRHVEILPRTKIELRYLLTILQNIMELTNQNIPFDRVRVNVEKNYVTSEESIKPSIIIRFHSDNPDPTCYFKNINYAYEKFINQIDYNIK